LYLRSISVALALVAGFIAGFVAAPCTAFAFEVEVGNAFGLDAARPLATRAGVSLLAGFVDASIETRNTDSEELDQRYVGTGSLEGAYSPIPAVGLRMFARGSYVDLLRQDSLSADRKVRASESSAGGSLDVTFAAAQGIEVFGGAGTVHLPKAERTIEMTSLTSQSRYEAVTVIAPRLGILKRTGVYAAGVTYSLMAEKERDYTRVTGLESDPGKEWVTLPAAFGAMARFTPGSGLELELELALVMMGESDEKTAQGAPYYRDSYRVRTGGRFPLGSFALFAALDHRTLSYNDQGFMTIDNIPRTNLELRVETTGGARAFAGAVVGYGTDSQSIPELNAEFTYLSYAFKLGIEVPM
jgi:hypothetical protein